MRARRQRYTAEQIRRLGPRRIAAEVAAIRVDTSDLPDPDFGEPRRREHIRKTGGLFFGWGSVEWRNDPLYFAANNRKR